MPWYAKALAALVAAYALSPIDLIPDFIPVLGYLDDVVLVPIGIWCVLQLVPPGLMAEFRAAAADQSFGQALGKKGAVLIVGLWLVAFVVILLVVRRIVS